MIRIDALWLATAPLDMRAGPDKALGRVVEVFGAARLHHAYLFANQRGTRMKVLVHDGQGLWLLARRLHQGKFVWPQGDLAAHIELNSTQWQALIMGLPWVPMALFGWCDPMRHGRLDGAAKHHTMCGAIPQACDGQQARWQ